MKLQNLPQELLKIFPKYSILISIRFFNLLYTRRKKR